MAWPTTSTFVAGNVLTAAQLNALRADIASINSYVVKTVDEFVTSNATAQNDDQLLFSIPAAGTYLIDAYLYVVSAANAAGDIRIGATWPSGTCHFGGIGPDPGLASGSVQTGEWKVNLSAASGSTVTSFGASTTNITIVNHFHLAATTSGTFQLQWAQVASNASATTVKAGSHMTMRQVA